MKKTILLTWSTYNCSRSWSHHLILILKFAYNWKRYWRVAQYCLATRILNFLINCFCVLCIYSTSGRRIVTSQPEIYVYTYHIAVELLSPKLRQSGPQNLRNTTGPRNIEPEDHWPTKYHRTWYFSLRFCVYPGCAFWKHTVHLEFRKP